MYSLFAVLVLNEPVHYFKKEGESVVAEIIAAVIVGACTIITRPIFSRKKLNSTTSRAVVPLRGSESENYVDGKGCF